jgi:hypothetical protein
MATLNQLQKTLFITYAVVPIVAGLDKFTNLLTNWSDYLDANIKSCRENAAVISSGRKYPDLIAP